MDFDAILLNSGNPLLAAVAVASAAASGVATWLIGARKIATSLQEKKFELGAGISATEANERASFRASLLAELAALRALVKEGEADRDRLREQLCAAESQIVVLRASNEILEKWINFLRARVGESIARSAPFSAHNDVPPVGD